MIERIEENVILWGLYNMYRRGRDPSTWWYYFLLIGIFFGILELFAFSFGLVSEKFEIVGGFVGMIFGVLMVGWLSYQFLMRGYI
jgi:membrane-bound ClpP family serine protease